MLNNRSSAPQQSLNVLLLAASAETTVGTDSVGEAVWQLARALRAAGHDARLSLPRVVSDEESREGLVRLGEPFAVPMNHRGERATIYQGEVGGVPAYLVSNRRYLGQGVARLRADDADPFVFFGRATLELLCRGTLDWQPHILHCHDWQAAIVPNWLTTLYRRESACAASASVLTIHNLAHQGIFGHRVLELAGLREYGYLTHAQISELSELVDLLARGIYHADALTTLGERYARDIQTPEFGERLDPLLRERSDRLFGVPHGIDTDIYDPAREGDLPVPYDAQRLDQRAGNKAALQQAVGLEADDDATLLFTAGHLDDAWGYDLISSGLDHLLANLPIQWLALGTGHARYRDLLSELGRRYPGRVAHQAVSSSSLERLAYAGGDILVMPRQPSPACSEHLIALRYGAVPVGRAVGSLADAVTDYRPLAETGNGFTYAGDNDMALYTALVRAIETRRHVDVWRGLQQRGMAADHSWAHTAERYVEVYRWALANRRTDD